MIPTRARLVRIADCIGAYAGLASRYPGCQDLLTVTRFAPQVACTADGMRQSLGRVRSWDVTPTWPPAIPGPPPWWADSYRLAASELGLPPNLAVGHGWAAALFDPILRRTLPPDATWNPARAEWA